MTRADVDLDRLADYIGGALDGTPEADAVARLVATDSDWAAAHAALTAADAAVHADLAILAAHSEPMPPEVADRLTGALTSARSEAGFSGAAVSGTAASEAGSAEAGSSGVGAADDAPAGDTDRPNLSVLAGGASGSRRRTAHRRRRWAAAVGVAAAVVAVGFGVTTELYQSTLEKNGATMTAQDANRNDQRGEAPAALPPDTNKSGELSTPPGLYSSGADYRPETLATLGRPFVATDSGPQSDSPSANAPGLPPSPGASGARGLTRSDTLAAGGDKVPGPLRRLVDPDPRAACLRAILREYNGTVSIVDYARFAGTPALIVVIEGANRVSGRRWVVVVGPDCGLEGAIRDVRYSGPLG